MIVINGLNPVRDIDDYVRDLADEGLPASAIVACLIRYAEAAPLLLALLARAADDDEDVEDIDPCRFFNAIHIMAGARDKRAFAPLLQVLRRPDEELDPLLGAAISTLPRIAIATFDGASKELFNAILDPKLSQLNRVALIEAATYLTWEGRIERKVMVEFLEQFESAGLADKGSMLWGSWFTAIALLGLRELVPALRRAEEKELIPDDVDLDHIAEVWSEAEQRPDDPERFELRDLGYIDNALETLQQYVELDEAYDEAMGEEWEGDEDEEGDEFEKEAFKLAFDSEVARLAAHTPVVNPLRNVGRNAPCPCGSGKKAKRCCLAA